MSTHYWLEGIPGLGVGISDYSQRPPHVIPTPSRSEARDFAKPNFGDEACSSEGGLCKIPRLVWPSFLRPNNGVGMTWHGQAGTPVLPSVFRRARALFPVFWP